ncbi:MAG: hypothetical protein VX210_15570 [Myxococcota bacterium]|nr:hypothetical protein [Myxococcota bacterium]
MSAYIIIFLALASVDVSVEKLQYDVHANARLALRDDYPEETLKLWFLQNSLESTSQEPGPHGDDFHSLTWTALSRLGICAEGLAKDSKGAGIWPIAQHNLMLKMLRKPPLASRLTPFDAFQLGYQQRFVGIYDVLNRDEISALKFRSNFCLTPYLEKAEIWDFPWSENDLRVTRAIVLKRLLQNALKTTANAKVRGQAVLSARIFDLNLYLIDQVERERRRARSEQARAGKTAQFSPNALRDMTHPRQRAFIGAEREQEEILKQGSQWESAEWLQLEPERRLYLFMKTAEFHKASMNLDKLLLQFIDVFIARKDGESLSHWLGVYQELSDGDPRQEIWNGQRGQRILELGPEEGFRERAVIRLHQGIHAIQTGDYLTGFKAFAESIALADTSIVPDKVRNLALRWITHTAGQFTLDATLLSILEKSLPKLEQIEILESLLWQAAWSGDKAAFKLGETQLARRRSATERMATIRPLASGNIKLLIQNLKQVSTQRPSAAMKIVELLLQTFERQTLERRRAHRTTLTALNRYLDWLIRNQDEKGFERRLNRLEDQLDSISLGLDNLNASDRVLQETSPYSTTFIGSIKLAPTDTPPWPFKIPTIKRPNPFSPIPLTPVEWRSSDNDLIMGWLLGR